MTTRPPRQHLSRKRNAVLDAAQASFLELGYAQTRMDLVAERAGVSKATVYAHFASKEDLFSAVIYRRCGDDLWRSDSWPLEDDARATLVAHRRTPAGADDVAGNAGDVSHSCRRIRASS